MGKNSIFLKFSVLYYPLKPTVVPPLYYVKGFALDPAAVQFQQNTSLKKILTVLGGSLWNFPFSHGKGSINMPRVSLRCFLWEYIFQRIFFIDQFGAIFSVSWCNKLWIYGGRISVKPLLDVAIDCFFISNLTPTPVPKFVYFSTLWG